MYSQKKVRSGNNRYFTEKTGGVGKGTRVPREVLAFSHSKQSEDFSKKNRRIVYTINWLASTLVTFPTGASFFCADVVSSIAPFLWRRRSF